MTRDDLPPLYADLDESSVSAQRTYLRVMRANLAVLLAAATVSSVTVAKVEVQQGLHVIGAVLIVLGLLMTVTLSKNAYEKTWYGARAAAETVKSLSWKYMQRAAPFTGPAETEAIDAALIRDLASILRDRRDLALSRATIARAGAPITPLMRDMRRRSVEERLAAYLSLRVQDQVRWYSEKAQSNEGSHALWFWVVIGVQIAAAGGAIWQIVIPSVPVNMSAVLAAFASVLLSWSQLKRHRELAQSYGLAAHDLGLSAGLAPHIASEERLSQFVNDTESAVSREHTMWVARREATE